MELVLPSLLFLLLALVAVIAGVESRDGYLPY